MQRVAAAPLFTIPLTPEWVRLVGTSSTRAYTLGGELNMRVPFGKQLTAVIAYEGGSPVGSWHCHSNRNWGETLFPSLSDGAVRPLSAARSSR